MTYAEKKELVVQPTTIGNRNMAARASPLPPNNKIIQITKAANYLGCRLRAIKPSSPKPNITRVAGSGTLAAATSPSRTAHAYLLSPFLSK